MQYRLLGKLCRGINQFGITRRVQNELVECELGLRNNQQHGDPVIEYLTRLGRN